MFVLFLITPIIAGCGGAPAVVSSTSTPVSTKTKFIFVQPEELVPPTVTPQPGNKINYDDLLMAYPGQKTKEYDGVTLMFHQAAPQKKMLLINMDGLKRLLDYLKQQSNTQLVFILAPDDREIMSPYDPESDVLVVQVHASLPAQQLNESLIAAILKRANIYLKTEEAKSKAYAIFAAMSCITADGYNNTLLPDDSSHIGEDDYNAMLTALCGIEGLVIYTDAIKAPEKATSEPVAPNTSNDGA